MLRDKIILVTGSSRGIGQAIVQNCLNNEATVIANYRNETPFIANLEKDYGSERCMIFSADISIDEEVSTMIRKIENKFGHIDGIVNNAGVISRSPNWKSIHHSEWLDTINTNVIGAWNVLRYGTEIMNDNGSIVNIASIYGMYPDSKTLTYSISKAGIIALTQALAKELSPKIRINAITPGNTLTQMTPDLKTQNMIENKTLLKRSAKANEIANVAVFLLSNYSSYITGSIIPVDGGYHII